MQQQIVSITQLNEYLKLRMDADPRLTSIAVRGEISNYKVYPSGYHYFTLKDEKSQLKCIISKYNARRLRFKPSDGMKVIALGAVSVYVPNGQHRLECTSMTLDGVGDRFAALEELKERLAREGLFDASHKKPLPRFPGTIGIVTSEAGAAIHDMLRILNKRYPLTQVRLLPVRVQGEEAPGEIAAAIYYANRYRLADLLIVGRGGGSIEDLWAFNDERVVRAIYASQIPVISAVGHEPDHTLSDAVADFSAATPSNAAENAVPDREALAQQLDAQCLAMSRIMSRRFKQARERLNGLAARPVLRSPQGYYDQRRKALELLRARLISAEQAGVSRYHRHFVAVTAKLDAMSPLKVLTRGYAVATDPSGQIIRSTAQVQPGQTIAVQVSDGTISANVIGEET